MLRTPKLAVALAAAVLVTAGAAHAQAPQQDPRARGPYRGLFGGNELDPNSVQALDVTASLFGGYDDDVTASRNAGTGGGGSGYGDPTAQASSSYFGGGASLRYARNVYERLNFAAGANVSSSYYADLDDLIATSYGARATLGWRIDPRTSLSASQSFRFSPFFGYSVFPVPGIPEPGAELDYGFDTRVVRQENFAYTTQAALSRRLTRRSRFSAFGTWQRTDFSHGESTYDDRQYWGAGALWSYDISPDLAARAGYGYRTTDYGGSEGNRQNLHTIDAGLDYSKALSFSRRTRFSFGTGTSAYTTTSADAAIEDQQLRFTVTGDARLTHEIGRSWVAALTYDRGVRLVNGFNESFVTDAVSAQIYGYPGARTRLALVSGVTWGVYGAQRDDNRRTRSVYVTPSAQFAISRHLALQASYFYYWYRFDDGAPDLPEGFLPEYSRQGFRLALSAWLPLLR